MIPLPSSTGIARPGVQDLHQSRLFGCYLPVGQNHAPQSANEALRGAALQHTLEVSADCITAGREATDLRLQYRQSRNVVIDASLMGFVLKPVEDREKFTIGKPTVHFRHRGEHRDPRAQRVAESAGVVRPRQRQEIQGIDTDLAPEVFGVGHDAIAINHCKYGIECKRSRRISFVAPSLKDSSATLGEKALRGDTAPTEVSLCVPILNRDDHGFELDRERMSMSYRGGLRQKVGGIFVRKLQTHRLKAPDQAGSAKTIRKQRIQIHKAFQAINGSVNGHEHVSGVWRHSGEPDHVHVTRRGGA